MTATHARVIIQTPARYMVRLCKHFEHRVAVHCEADRARIEFEGAPCSLVAYADALDIRIEAKDVRTLERFREVVGRHLKQVASKEVFEIDWQGD